MSEYPDSIRYIVAYTLEDISGETVFFNDPLSVYIKDESSFDRLINTIETKRNVIINHKIKRDLTITVERFIDAATSAWYFASHASLGAYTPRDTTDYYKNKPV